MSSVLPRFFYLTPDKVQEIRTDAELRREKAILHFIPDVHDLAHFCFPINPQSPLSTRISDIADEQVTLFEIFQRREPKPILVQEYEHELWRNYRSLKQSSEFAYTRTEMLNELLQHIEHVPSDSPASDTVKSLEQDFNLVVAVVTGIYSLGLQRWQEVVTERLLLESKFAGLIDPQILKGFHDYRPTPLVDEIKAMLIAKIPKNSAMETRRFVRERAAENDARVVDKVLHLNRYLENVYKKGLLPQRHLFLYFASARKTSSIFALPSVRQALPVINGKPYSPWRNSTQVFLSLVLKPGSAREDSSEELSVLIDNLLRFEQLLGNVHRPRNFPGVYEKCSDCVLNGGKGRSCSWSELCKLITNLSGEYLKHDANVLPNLGLLANIKQYSKFARRHSELASGEDVRQLFRSLLQDREIRDVTLERIWLVQQSMSLNSVLLQATPRELSNDVITSAMQVLPFALQIQEKRYREVVSDLIEYYQVPYNNVDKKQTLLSKVYGAFAALDRAIVRFNPEHELVRSLIYLAFESGKRTGRSLEQVRTALRRLEAEKLENQWFVEFAYVLIWALRLHDLNQECDQYACDILSKVPDDARLHHGLLLNSYLWYEKAGGPYKIADLISQGQKTRDLYIKLRSNYRKSLSTPDLVDGLIGVSFNDLAYLNCFGQPPNDLAATHEYLEQVCKYVPRDQWPERFPEYLHTEAMLLFREAQETRSLVKLAEASLKLELAMKNRNTALVVGLQRQIERFRMELERQ